MNPEVKETQGAAAQEQPSSYATIDIYESAAENIFLYSAPVSEDAVKVRGYDFNNGVDIHGIINSWKSSGFQATNFYDACEVIKELLEVREKTPGFKFYLGYTSNQISCGNREIIRFLVQHKLVDAIVTSAGGIEEDFIKCLAPTILGDFHLDGRMLRKKGLNRIGNLIMPNNNYCDFEDFLMPLLDECWEKQQKEAFVWSPRKFIRFLGEKINNEDSVYYWAAKNDIPVYCPAITDGSIGDMLYFHDIKKGGFILDIVQDIRHLNESAVRASMTGVLLLGGGTMKHHILNANMMRNGTDFAVYINTGLEYDGSDSGAAPEEALSWGKIKASAKPVKVHMEASIALPLLVAHTFAPFVHARRAASEA